MYVVIFRAKIHKLDDDYLAMAEKMRQLALSRYNCIEFVSVVEGDDEIALSYWHSGDDIRRWKQDAEHLLAQQLGQSRWYSSYQVQVTRIVREYTHPPVADF